jgi:hypothetical protein
MKVVSMAQPLTLLDIASACRRKLRSVVFTGHPAGSSAVQVFDCSPIQSSLVVSSSCRKIGDMS